MDASHRQISKIAREAGRYAAGTLRKRGLGATEYECLRLIRKNEGLNQERLAELLNVDKAAVTRMLSNLEKKGYVKRSKDPLDKRSNKLAATEKALEVKMDETDAEGLFYEWLLADIAPFEAEVFLSVLERLYAKAKNERREGFAELRIWAERRGISI